MSPGLVCAFILLGGFLLNGLVAFWVAGRVASQVTAKVRRELKKEFDEARAYDREAYQNFVKSLTKPSPYTNGG
jgi:hypothetical protein